MGPVFSHLLGQNPEGPSRLAVKGRGAVAHVPKVQGEAAKGLRPDQFFQAPEGHWPKPSQLQHVKVCHRTLPTIVEPDVSGSLGRRTTHPVGPVQYVQSKSGVSGFCMGPESKHAVAKIRFVFKWGAQKISASRLGPSLTTPHKATLATSTPISRQFSTWHSKATVLCA